MTGAPDVVTSVRFWSAIWCCSQPASSCRETELEQSDSNSLRKEGERELTIDLGTFEDTLHLESRQVSPSSWAWINSKPVPKKKRSIDTLVETIIQLTKSPP